MNVDVSSLARLHQSYERCRPTHVVSVLDPTVAPARIPTFARAQAVLQLFFYDEDDLDLQQEPLDMPLRRILAFLLEFIGAPQPDKRLLVHCHAGASRSPAIVYILFAMKLGEGKEAEAFAELMARTVKPWPNRKLIELADVALERSNKMLGPLEAYRAKFPRRYEAYQRLNRRRVL
jgi:predicted protein tyrosine phosphatase